MIWYTYLMTFQETRSADKSEPHCLVLEGTQITHISLVLPKTSEFIHQNINIVNLSVLLLFLSDQNVKTKKHSMDWNSTEKERQLTPAFFPVREKPVLRLWNWNILGYSIKHQSNSSINKWNMRKEAAHTFFFREWCKGLFLVLVRITQKFLKTVTIQIKDKGQVHAADRDEPIWHDVLQTNDILLSLSLSSSQRRCRHASCSVRKIQP